LEVFSGNHDTDAQDVSHPVHVEIKDPNPQGYLVQWDLIKKILEQHPNAAAIGAFKLGHE
jgi:hypothetical protein